MSTNVAEASVTIDGIVFVVDSGKAQISGFDAKTGVATLIPSWIEKANANQSRGRSAGQGQVNVIDCTRSKRIINFQHLEHQRSAEQT